MATSFVGTRLRFSGPSAARSGSRRPAAFVHCRLSSFSKLGLHLNKRYDLSKPFPLTSLGHVGTSPAAFLDVRSESASSKVGYKGVHHVAVLCENLERSLEFYTGILGLSINPERPDAKLPYRGKWLWIGPEMVHLMELPNPDPLTGRPSHGGRDRHFAIGVDDLEPLMARLDAAGIPYTKSMSGRPAVFFRDPDMNCLEAVQAEAWR